MTIDFNLLPENDKNHWECENCGHKIDLSWVLEDLVEECSENEIYKKYLFESTTFDHSECSACYHSICFNEEETKELQSFVKNNLKES